MFCAMATVIDRCKTEGIVDVFQVVKALRISKPGAVPTLVSIDWLQVSTWILSILYGTQENYKAIFDVTLDFLDSFDAYANFQTVL